MNLAPWLYISMNWKYLRQLPSAYVVKEKDTEFYHRKMLVQVSVLAIWLQMHLTALKCISSCVKWRHEWHPLLWGLLGPNELSCKKSSSSFKHYMNTSYYCCGANNFPPELQQCPPLWFPNKRGNLHMVGVHFLFVNALITSSQLCPGAAEVSLDFLLWDSMKFNFSTAPFLFPFPPLQNFQVAWARELVCKPWGKARKGGEPQESYQALHPFHVALELYRGAARPYWTLVIPQPVCWAHTPQLITEWTGAGPLELVVPESEPLFRKPYKHVATEVIMKLEVYSLFFKHY